MWKLGAALAILGAVIATHPNTPDDAIMGGIMAVAGALLAVSPILLSAESSTRRTTMQDFQQRVVTEKTELDEKLGKLQVFLNTPRFMGLPADEQSRMVRQASAMSEYSVVLGERIAAFT